MGKLKGFFFYEIKDIFDWKPEKRLESNRFNCGFICYWILCNCLVFLGDLFDVVLLWIKVLFEI
jgi:hypothetical protein